MTKIFEAIDFAQKAHSGQFRKGTPIPYIIHPLEVMKILLQFTDDLSLQEYYMILWKTRKQEKKKFYNFSGKKF